MANVEVRLESLDRITFDAAELVRSHAPRWSHPNKLVVFERACSSGHPFEGVMVFARWPASRVPELVPARRAFRLHPGFFTYVPGADPGAVEWHMNFADPLLFAAYGSALLAQDELQVAEHPILGSLRDALVGLRRPAETVDERGRTTPVTITGVQRRCAIDTAPSLERPQGLYGNAFAAAPAEQVREATRPLSPPTISNILAMAAPAHGSGAYSRSDIESVLLTAYSGFLAARTESARLASAKGTAVVHTGFWGCGAFGGNRALMTILQALAADLAEIDLEFHAADAAGVAMARTALESYERLRASNTTVPQIVDALVLASYPWGRSDGN